MEFVNALAMPKGSRASSWMFSWTVRALLAVFPVAVLLSVQLQSLRLQNYLGELDAPYLHRCRSGAADLVLRAIAAVTTPGISGRHRCSGRWRCAGWRPWSWRWIYCGWKCLGRMPDSPRRYSRLCQRLLEGGAARPTSSRVLLALPVQPIDMVLCAHAHVGCRFLTVAHRNLVAKILDATTFVALRAGADADEKHLASFEVASLRGRRLRFADLTASELFAADLTGADSP